MPMRPTLLSRLPIKKSREQIMSVDTSDGHPDMDYVEHRRTYSGFITGVIWGTVATVIVLILMAVFLI